MSTAAFACHRSDAADSVVSDTGPHPGAPPGSLYSVLGVAVDASDSQVRAAYHRRARLLHPDVVGDSTEFTAQMAELNQVYATLSNPLKRAEYDRTLRAMLTVVPGEDVAGASWDVDDVAGRPVPGSPLSAAVAVCAALGGICLGLSFAVLSGGLAVFGALLLGASAVLSAVRFRQAVQRPRSRGASSASSVSHDPNDRHDQA